MKITSSLKVSTQLWDSKKFLCHEIFTLENACWPDDETETAGGPDQIHDQIEALYKWEYLFDYQYVAVQ